VDRTGAPGSKLRILGMRLSFIPRISTLAGPHPFQCIPFSQLSPPRSIFFLRVSFHSEVYAYGSTAPGSERFMLDLNALTR
jgi:hypothetical protein